MDICSIIIRNHIFVNIWKYRVQIQICNQFPRTVHNIGLHDFAQPNDDFNRQMQQAMAQSQRQQNAFFNNPFGGPMFGQGGGFPFWTVNLVLKIKKNEFVNLDVVKMPISLFLSPSS